MASIRMHGRIVIAVSRRQPPAARADVLPHVGRPRTPPAPTEASREAPSLHPVPRRGDGASTYRGGRISEGYSWTSGAIRMIAMPVRQKTAPMTSHRVGVCASTTHSQAIDAVMYMPP